MTFWNQTSTSAVRMIVGCACTLGFGASLLAQQPLPATQRPATGVGVAKAKAKAQAPATQPHTGELEKTTALEKRDIQIRMDPVMEKLLDQWEAVSTKVHRIEGDFDLYRYDEVFQTETRANGTFWHESPDKGRMEFKPIPQDELDKCPKNAANMPINPSMKGPDGQPYEIKSQDQECWLCDGETIIQAMLKPERAYHKREIPTQFRGESIRESPLPFLFGLKKKEARERYLLSFGDFHNKQLKGAKAPVIHLIALPLRAADAQEWSKAEVILHSDTFLPHSIRTVDPAGTTKCVYVFKRVDVNPKWLVSNPFRINLRGFKKLEESTDRDTNVAPTSGTFGKPAAN